jgi:hypothetical protein
MVLPGFERPFERELDKENRWVVLSHLIPWDEICEIYRRQVPVSSTGRPGINPRKRRWYPEKEQSRKGEKIMKHLRCLRIKEGKEK